MWHHYLIWNRGISQFQVVFARPEIKVKSYELQAQFVVSFDHITTTTTILDKNQNTFDSVLFIRNLIAKLTEMY